uniref:Uncharacterized protein n=1 Tax=Rhizophora mucronata TaxID=61149 RepID=A0A2P2JBF0_RHIMU
MIGLVWVLQGPYSYPRSIPCLSCYFISLHPPQLKTVKFNLIGFQSFKNTSSSFQGVDILFTHSITLVRLRTSFAQPTT